MKNLILLLSLIPIVLFGQTAVSNDILWSETRNLRLEDYKIYSSDENTVAYTNFSIYFQLMGFDAMSKNLNQKVFNKFSGSSSIINPSIPDLQRVLDYQQVCFDLNEVFTRKLRKELLLNKNTLWEGFSEANRIHSTITSDASRVQMLMNNETKGGTLEGKVNEWRAKIKLELNRLEEFRFENSKKIKFDNNLEENTWNINSI